MAGNLGSGSGGNLNSIPGQVLGSGSGGPLEGILVGIPAKQLRLEADGSLQADATNGGLEVKLNGSTLSSTASGLSVGSGVITGTHLATSAAGNGLTGGGGSALSVLPNTTDGGGIPGVEVAANGLRIATAAAGNGLTGGGGSALAASVAANKGVKVDGSGIAIDEANASTSVSISAGSWTFTVDTLQVTGTPDTANDPVNKSYADSLVSGIQWNEPVDLMNYVGNAAETTIEGLSPNDGDTYVVSATDGDATIDGTAAEVGDIFQYDGANWQLIVDQSSNYPPAGTRAVCAEDDGTPLISPLTDNTDNAKYAEWDGTSLTPTLTSPSDGDGILVNGEGAYWENNAFVFDGGVPTGSWIQFSGAGQVNAGSGLTKDGNTLNVGEGNGITVNADDVAVNPAQLITGGNAEIDGDKLDIDWDPTNYTPSTTPTEADSVDNLTAHLYGIDQQLGSLGGTARQEEITTQAISGSDTAMTDTLTNTPTAVLAVKIYLNGILQQQGSGKDYTLGGTGNKTITWLASSGTAVDQDTNDVMVAAYTSSD